MPKETQQTTQVPPTNDPSTATQLTGVPTIEHDEFPEVPMTGTLSEMLTLGKGKKKPTEPKPDKAKEKEEAKAAVDEKLKSFLFGKDRKKPEPEKPTEPEPKEEPVDPGPEEPKPAKAKEVKRKAVVKDHAADLAEKFAELEKQRVELEKQRLEIERQKLKAQERPEPTRVDSLESLSDDERYELEVLQQLAKQNPSKYGDHPKKFTELARKTAEYKAKWEAENEGESFDPDDSAHDAFFSKNQVRYDKKDFRAAELALVQPEKPKDESTHKEIRELKAKEKVREVMPRAIQVFAEGVESFLNELDPAMAKAAKEGGRAKLLEEFPDDADEILKAAQSIEAVSIEAHRVLETDGLVELDFNNKVHNLIVDIIRRKEPVTIGTRDSEGRKFATWEQWANMSEQQRAAHWHLGAAEIVDIVTQELAGSVRAELDRINARVQNRLKRTVPNEPPARPKASPVTSPSTVNRATVDTTSKLRNGGKDKFQESITKALFSRPSLK